MAIFARRSLQRMLSSIAEQQPDLPLRKIVDGLNRPTFEALGFEWELVIIHILLATGSVRNEANLGGTSRPDIFYEARGGDGLRFVADVATPSDAARDRENPVKRLWDLLGQRSGKLRLDGGFDIRVEGRLQGPHRDAKMALALPAAKHIDRFFEERVTPWLKGIRARKPDREAMMIAEGDVEFILTYDANARFWTGGHPSYEAAYSLRRNSVYSALKEKADQLRNSGFDGPMGIFLCDGNCSLLRPRSSGPTAFDLPQILAAFVQSNNSSISFFAVATIIESGFSAHDQKIRLDIKVYPNPQARYPIEASRIIEALKGMKFLPPPVATAMNALSWINGFPREGRPFGYIKYGMGSTVTKISFSTRVLLDLLTGKISYEEFAQMVSDPGQPFTRARDIGHMIRNLTVTHLPDTDDDVVEFELAGPDPAISKFRDPAPRGPESSASRP